MNMENKIIDNKQNKLSRFFENIISMLGWSYIVIILIQLLFSVLFWIFGISYLYKYILIGNIELTISVLKKSLIIAIFGFLIIILWSKYNYVSYVKLYRRSYKKKHTSPKEISNYFNISEQDVYKIQNSKYIEIEDNIL